MSRSARSRGSGACRRTIAATTRCTWPASELGIPFCTQVGHTGPLRSSEPGRPIPYIDDVALDFPELVIVGGHIGYPWTDEMLALTHKYENVWIDTSAYTVRRYPPALVNELQRSRHKVLFGSNFPMITPQRCLEDLGALDLPPEQRERFLGGNAAGVFGLGALGSLQNWISAATAPGASRGSACPAPATTTSRPCGSPAASRSPSARNFASRSPASTVAGIANSPRRPQSGAIAPVPTARSAAASAAGSLRAMSSRASRWASGGSEANSGRPSQRSANASIPPDSMSAASVASARSAPLAVALVVDARGARHEHEPPDARRGLERDVQGDPPAHRVAAQVEAGRRRGQDIGHAGLERDRPQVTRRAVAAQVGGQRPIALRVQPLDDRVPAAPGAGEPVEEDDGLGHGHS